MKKMCLGALLALTLALAATVFAFGPESDCTGPPPMAEPHFPGITGFGPGDPHIFHRMKGPGNIAGGPRPGFHERDGFARYLNLSVEQIDKTRAIAERSFQETRDLRYELLHRDLEMHKLFSDPKVDEATLLAKQKEVNSLHQKLIEKIAEAKIKERMILTPEQIRKMDRIPAGGMDLGRTGITQ